MKSVILASAAASVYGKCEPGIKIEYFTDSTCKTKNPEKTVEYKKEHMHELNDCYRIRHANRKMYHKSFCDSKGMYWGVYEDELCKGR